MKVICSKENLIEGINIVQKAVSTKTTLPILEGILLEAGEEFKLTGNDLEIGIECFVEADIRQQGSIVLNSKMFGEIVRRLPDSEILLEVKENNSVTIECDNSHFEIKGIPAAGFPAIPSIVKENAFSISQKIIREMIRQTIFAVGVDEYRPILTGTMIECREGSLIFVSLDGFRMALRKNNIENKDTEFKVVVPGKTLNEVLKILQPADNEVTIYNSKNQILFDIGKCKVVSRLLEGEYLNYKSLIIKDYETTIKANTRELLSSIERASLITMDEKRYPVKFNISDERMIISSNTEIGSVREEVKIDMNGNRLEIGFNPRLFIESLRTIEEEIIELSFVSNVVPCIIRPLDKDTFVHVISPVRT